MCCWAGWPREAKIIRQRPGAALYSTVLVHEERYWANVYRDRAGDPRPRVLRRAAVCLTLLAPTSAEAGQVLRSVPELTDAAEWRESIREVLTECFRAGPGEVLALRPDPVADYLAVQVLSDDPDLLDQCLNSLDNARLPYVLANLNLGRVGSHPQQLQTFSRDGSDGTPTGGGPCSLSLLRKPAAPLPPLRNLSGRGRSCRLTRWQRRSLCGTSNWSLLGLLLRPGALMYCAEQVIPIPQRLRSNWSS